MVALVGGKMFGKSYDGYQRLEVEEHNHEHSQKLPGLPKKIYFTMFVTVVAALSMFLYNFFLSSMLSGELSPSDSTPIDDSEYLVLSSKCKLINLDPFNEEALKFYAPKSYKPCTKLQLLTNVTKGDNFSTVHIREDLIPLYSKNEIMCCYSNVSRELDSDAGATFTACRLFQDNITITSNAVMIRCIDSNTTKSVYENAHIAVTPTEAVMEKMESFDQSKKPFSVLFIGIDSISRLNLIRSMPETYKFLEENDNWVPLKGYNKIDDNTFPNLMAVLSGFNLTHAYETCDPYITAGLNKCPMIWNDYRDLGYITAYAEDESSINTFNYLKKGFTVSPTDYYFRPYFMATENLKGSTKYCTGPEMAGERIMNIATDFSTTFKSYPTFGFFWMNSFSHDLINDPSAMDQRVKTLLNGLIQEEINQETIIVFLSDHGMRFGEFRLTTSGWYEEKLPFIYISFPERFQKEFPTEFTNFKGNTNKLTCPYDLYMTLQQILVLSGHNYSMTPANACPLCRSLFEPVDPDRSCREANITQHWCACTEYEEEEFQTEQQANALNFTLNSIHEVLANNDMEKHCQKFSVAEVMKMKVSQPTPYDNTTYIFFQYKTEPFAIFEATVAVVNDTDNIDDNFELTGEISRLDSYGKHTRCINSSYLKKYCYCF